MIGALLGAASSILGPGGALGSTPDTNIRNADLDGRQSVTWGSSFQVGGVGNSASSAPTSAPINGAALTGGMSPALLIVAAVALLALLIPRRAKGKKRRA